MLKKFSFIENIRFIESIPTIFNKKKLCDTLLHFTENMLKN